MPQPQHDGSPQKEPIASATALLLHIARALAFHPECVEVFALHEDNATLFSVEMASEDVTRLGGKQGRSVTSMQTLLHTIAGKAGQRFKLEVVSARQSVDAPVLQ